MCNTTARISPDYSETPPPRGCRSDLAEPRKFCVLLSLDLNYFVRVVRVWAQQLKLYGQLTRRWVLAMMGMKRKL